jgi:hypothetical protein
MSLRNAAVAALAGALVAGTPARAATVIAESRFDTGAEGWRNGDFTGGNAVHDVGWRIEDGFITAADDHEQFTAFLAPAAYLGDRRDARGGTLGFDIASRFRDTNGAELPYVTLHGAGILLFGLLSANPPGETFSRYEVVLAAENFLRGNPEDGVGTSPVSEAQFAAVLRSLTQLSIRADIASGQDLASLDNVVLTAGSVPEPDAWLLMIIGAGHAGASVRRRMRRDLSSTAQP